MKFSKKTEYGLLALIDMAIQQQRGAGGRLTTRDIAARQQIPERFLEQQITALRNAGQCLFHLVHAHFHYKDLVSFTLYDANGRQVGRSLKESFCLGDDDYFGFGTSGPNGPRPYVGQPGCNVPAQLKPSVAVEEGISSGWGDVYTWDTPGQFIDISSAPPGIYKLVERTNPSNSILVAGPSQTCAVTTLRLSATAVQELSTSQGCPTP